MRGCALAVILCATSITWSAGCGSASGGAGAATQPVKGTVTYKGKPVTKGTVTFEPDGRGKEAFGELQSDGTFELTTYKPGDGAVIGNHRVAIRNPDRSFPSKYRSLSSSKLEIEVKEGTTDYPIELN